MPVFPIPHSTWQILRTVKRNKKPPTGRVLRLVPTARTRDGTFLSDLVGLGLLSRVTGTADAPFEATYALTERGAYAAEYGECERPIRTNSGEVVLTVPPKLDPKHKGAARGKT